MVRYENTSACFVSVIRNNGGKAIKAIPGHVVDCSYNRGVIFEYGAGRDGARGISANISK